MDLLTWLNRDRGITILMVTHESEMAEYAHRVIHFRDGQVTDDGLGGRQAATGAGSHPKETL